MKLTKYEHACVVLEEQGKKLVIDPGAFCQSFTDASNVVALVITHEHPDHYEPRYIDLITKANPDVRIFAPADLAAKMGDPNVAIMHDGSSASVEPFELKFYGEQHAEIHPTFTPPNNVGVLVNGTVYYPGDSFTLPEGMQPGVLLAPVSAPWLKIGETIDFIDAVRPKVVIPTHNALLSDIANTITEQWLKKTCEKHGTAYKHLNPGDSIDI
jgi:L-ascorbate metabolism protein UlaG (beta-lactamase superfamily)